MEPRPGTPAGHPTHRAPPDSSGGAEWIRAVAPDPGHPAVLNAAHISKSFAGVAALRDVGFSLRRGEVHALMGENGAGKSTLMKILAGVHTDYDGTVAVEGEPVAFTGVRDAEGAGVAIIHQELNLV